MKTNQGNRMVLPVKVTLTKKDIDAHVNQPLRDSIKVYKKQLASRDKYIKQLHESLRNKKSLIMMAHVIDEVMQPMPKLLSKKRLLILAELYDKDYVSESRLRDLMVKLNMNVKTGRDFNYLIENGLIQKHTKYSYYITDQGKQFVEYFDKNTRIMFLNMMSNREGFQIYRAKKKANVSEELKTLRSENYKRMMQPFWDNGLRMMPKNRENRCKILWEWMKENGNTNHDFYLRMLHKWSGKK
jgi:predicted transcriptional regulator